MPGGIDQALVAEADLGQLEGGPVEARVERVGDGDDLGRRRGRRVVLEVDAVRKDGTGGDVVIFAERGGPSFLVWIRRIDCLHRNLIDAL